MNKNHSYLDFVKGEDVKTYFHQKLRDNGVCDIENFAFPLDKEVLHEINSIAIRDSDDDMEIFAYSQIIIKLWGMIIDKSIICLRYFDKREPFMSINDKKPTTYGLSEMKEYFQKYINFERLLYGNGKYYRDHVIHMFRVWLLGLYSLLNKKDFIERIKIDGDVQINEIEKIAIWSIISLTHDLGYPLQQAQEIISNTKDMMSSFVSNPNISMDIGYSGVQSNMNDFILRLISSKMIRNRTEEGSETRYIARLQPKYYFKFQKSLENYKHGTISVIIIYKMLLYFLESDFNINEDYSYSQEDMRQFYIRREILRAIASHTCSDIYHLNIFNFSYLLIVADDAQEWGRRTLSEFLHQKDNVAYVFDNIFHNFDIAYDDKVKHETRVREKFVGIKRQDIFDDIVGRMKKQFRDYKRVFRDGQETATRDFEFIKDCILEFEHGPNTLKVIVSFCIKMESRSYITITVEKTGTCCDDVLDENWAKTMLGSDVQNNSTDVKLIYRQY